MSGVLSLPLGHFNLLCWPASPGVSPREQTCLGLHIPHSGWLPRRAPRSCRPSAPGAEPGEHGPAAEPGAGAGTSIPFPTAQPPSGTMELSVGWTRPGNAFPSESKRQRRGKPGEVQQSIFHLILLNAAEGSVSCGRSLLHRRYTSVLRGATPGNVWHATVSRFCHVSAVDDLHGEGESRGASARRVTHLDASVCPALGHQERAGSDRHRPRPSAIILSLTEKF